MVVTVFLLRSLLLVTVTDAAEDEAKPLAKPHPYLVSTPPLTEEDFQVFVALQKPCTFDAKKTALGDLAKQLSELVNVEIKIDGDGLRRAKPKPIDPDVRFTTKQDGTPLQSVLWEILPPLGLDYRVFEGRLVITSRMRSQHNRVTWTFPVSDLCATNREFDHLIRQVHSMFPVDEWEDMGGPAELKIDKANRRFTIIHAQSNQDRVLGFLTQERLAKKQAKR